MSFKIGDKIILNADCEFKNGVYLEKGTVGTIVQNYGEAYKTALIKWDMGSLRGKYICFCKKNIIQKYSDIYNFKIGDLVCGKYMEAERYGITNHNMTKALVTDIGLTMKSGDIRIKILEHNHKKYIGDCYIVDSKYFDIFK